MRKVKVESEKMMWPLIMYRSNHKTKQRFVSTWPQIWSKSVEISVDCENASAPLLASPPRAPEMRFILCILAIVLSIATIFDAVFGLKSREFGFVDNVFNGFNESKLELECDLRDALSSHTNSTIDVMIVVYHHHQQIIRLILQIHKYLILVQQVLDWQNLII